mgnify:CR=1 FL=1
MVVSTSLFSLDYEWELCVSTSLLVPVSLSALGPTCVSGLHGWVAPRVPVGLVVRSDVV